MVRAGKFAMGAALAGLWFAATPRANAAYIVDLYQDGANVVATGSGSIDTAGLSFFFHNGTANGAIIPGHSTITLGPVGPVDWYNGYTGPANFGSGGGVNPSSETGSSVTLYYSANWLGLPAGYTSNSALGTSTATWNNTTLAALGVTPGSYTWNWGTGADADSFTLNVEAPVPEPASLAMLAVGLVGLGFSRRRRG